MDFEVTKKLPESFEKVDAVIDVCYEDTVANALKNIDARNISKETKKRLTDKSKELKDLKKHEFFKGISVDTDVGCKHVILSLKKNVKPHEIQVAIRKNINSILKEMKNCCYINVEEISKGSQDLVVEYIASASKMVEWKQPVYGKKAKDDDRKKDKNNKKIFFITQIKESELAEVSRKGTLLGEANNLVRTLAVTPGNYLAPGQYQELIQGRAQRNKYIYRFFDYDKLKKMNAGAFSAVLSADPQNQGGLVHIQYKPKNKSQGKIVLVGKGLCYDTGGINVKPSKYMFSMHRDMTGSAVALAIFEYMVKTEAPYEIHGLLGLAENHISPTGYKPNDVVTTMNGKSIEVVHTDAEGRMVLADVLCFASELKPDLMLDYATLTGAAVYAIGNARSAVFSNNKKLVKMATDSGDTTGERVWSFPIGDEYFDNLKSDVADIKQCVLDAGPDHIEAATFLNEFVEESIPWLHVDLSCEEHKGGLGLVDSDVTGFGVRLSVDVIEKFFKK